MSHPETTNSIRLRNNALALFDQGLVSAASFAVTVCVGRYGSDSELGLFVLGTTLVVAVVSLHESLISMPFIFLASQKKDMVTFTGSLVAHVVMLGIAAMALLLGGSVLGQFVTFPDGLSLVLAAVGLIIPFHLMRQFVRRFFFARMDLLGLLAYDVPACVLQVALLFGLGHLGGLSGATGHLAIGLVGVLMSIVWLIHFRDEYRIRRPRVLEDLNANFAFGKYACGSQFLWILHVQMLVWILTFANGTAVAGQFGACLSVTLLANPFVLGMLNIVSPRVVRGFSEGGNRRLRKVVWQNWWFMVGGVAFLFAGLSMFGAELVEMLFGAGFANHQTTITLLAISMLAETACKTPEHGLHALGKPNLATVVNAVRLGITIACAIVLIPRYSLSGAALSLVIADTIAAVLLGGIFLRETSESLESWRPQST